MSDLGSLFSSVRSITGRFGVDLDECCREGKGGGVWRVGLIVNVPYHLSSNSRARFLKENSVSVGIPMRASVHLTAIAFGNKTDMFYY